MTQANQPPDGPDVPDRLRMLTSLLLRNIISYMSRDNRLSGVLHILLHMMERSGPVSSAVLARMMQTNPVVIRRVLAGLREQGYVRSDSGHGGGWSIACDPADVTLLDIYRSIGAPSLFAIANRNETTPCAVEQAVNTALNDTFGRAEDLLLASFAQVTLASLSADFHKNLIRKEPGLCKGAADAE